MPRRKPLSSVRLPTSGSRYVPRIAFGCSFLGTATSTASGHRFTWRAAICTLGKLFTGIKSQEQVIWMTHSASGWFLKPLSAKGRIVITATAAGEEYNETEFPHALAAITGKLKAKTDAKISVLELYKHTVAEVEARFAADKRVPTEHAQLDDNGDGVGTEEPIVEKVVGKKVTADGALAARTFLPLRHGKK